MMLSSVAAGMASARRVTFLQGNSSLKEEQKQEYSTNFKHHPYRHIRSFSEPFNSKEGTLSVIQNGIFSVMEAQRGFQTSLAEQRYETPSPARSETPDYTTMRSDDPRYVEHAVSFYQALIQGPGPSRVARPAGGVPSRRGSESSTTGPTTTTGGDEFDDEYHDNLPGGKGTRDRSYSLMEALAVDPDDVTGRSGEGESRGRRSRLLSFSSGSGSSRRRSSSCSSDGTIRPTRNSNASAPSGAEDSTRPTGSLRLPSFTSFAGIRALTADGSIRSRSSSTASTDSSNSTGGASTTTSASATERGVSVTSTPPRGFRLLSPGAGSDSRIKRGIAVIGSYLRRQFSKDEQNTWMGPYDDEPRQIKYPPSPKAKFEGTFFADIDQTGIISRGKGNNHPTLRPIEELYNLAFIQRYNPENSSQREEIEHRQALMYALCAIQAELEFSVDVIDHYETQLEHNREYLAEHERLCHDQLVEEHERIKIYGQTRNADGRTKTQCIIGKLDFYTSVRWYQEKTWGGIIKDAKERHKLCMSDLAKLEIHIFKIDPSAGVNLAHDAADIGMTSGLGYNRPVRSRVRRVRRSNSQADESEDAPGGFQTDPAAEVEASQESELESEDTENTEPEETDGLLIEKSAFDWDSEPELEWTDDESSEESDSDDESILS